MQRWLVHNFTYTLEWGRGTCTLTKHAWRWTYSALRYFSFIMLQLFLTKWYEISASTYIQTGSSNGQFQGERGSVTLSNMKDWSLMSESYKTESWLQWDFVTQHYFQWVMSNFAFAQTLMWRKQWRGHTAKNVKSFLPLQKKWENRSNPTRASFFIIASQLTSTVEFMR